MSNFFMGVDPGATGAAAFIAESGSYICFRDYPGSATALGIEINQILCLSLFLDKPSLNQILLAVIENVHPMPEQGISSTGKFMKNAGIWEGVLGALQIPYELITPQRWRKILDSSVPQKPTKEDLVAYTIRRWPDAANALQRKKDHNRAEALIMAEYARLKFLGEAK